MSPAPAPPPTVILVHRTEKTRKCSVWPLRGRPDLVFRRFPLQGDPLELPGYVRLGIGGPVLGPPDTASGILLLDATWRHVQGMEEAYRDLPVRSLPPLVTAYPRTSKLFEDPQGGLASVEALYAALVLLGRDTRGLLDHYHWKDEFLERNRAQLAPGT